MSTTRSPRRTRPAIVVALVAATVALIGVGTAVAGTPAAQAFRDQPLVAGTPCTVTARACVDLDTQRSWLFTDGKITHGPVPVAIGGPGKETPVGHSLRVYRKEQLHKSGEYTMTNGEPAPMPWAVFFQDGGIAFHSGDPNRSSAGCIHVPPDEAKAYFDYLQIGDQVQVVKASEETASKVSEESERHRASSASRMTS